MVDESAIIVAVSVDMVVSSVVVVVSSVFLLSQAAKVSMLPTNRIDNTFFIPVNLFFLF